MFAIALGLAASLSWGVADFFGGIQSRRMPVVAVVLGSQLAGLVLVATIVAVRGEPIPDGADFLAYAALSSVAGIVGLTSFYKGLSVGAMGVVAPLSSLAAAIPLVVGIATGDRPGALQAAGVAIAIVGVLLASREAGEHGQGGSVAKGAGFALISAVGFGCFFLAIDKASDDDVLWAVCVNRTVSVTLLGLALLATRPKLGLRPVDMRMLAIVGVLDILANGFFALAATKGLVSVVAVLASLYPVVTVVLARVVLKERLQVSQRIGAALALTGAALISVAA
jgi:drug/metabolite transporter (DMT)-like permease